MNGFKFSLIIIFCILSKNIPCQSLDLSAFELRAHFPLIENGEDVIGNHSDIQLIEPIFSEGGIYSRGCYAFAGPDQNENCLIQTPKLSSLNDSAYAVQLDFKLSDFMPSVLNPNRAPIIFFGRGHRFIGLSTDSTSNLYLTVNNHVHEKIDSIVLDQNKWYNVVIMHNKPDSTTQVFLDQNLVIAKTKTLIYPPDDVTVTNLNFSSGGGFHGYWKDLKVYSIGTTTNVKHEVGKTNQIKLYPNPTDGFINIESDYTENSLNYLITDVNGNIVKDSRLVNNIIDTQELQTGLYFLVLYKEDAVLKRIKFVKQ